MRDLVSMFKGHYRKFFYHHNDELVAHSAQSKTKEKSIPWADAQEANVYHSAFCHDTIKEPVWLDGEDGDLVHLSKKDRGGGLNEIPD